MNQRTPAELRTFLESQGIDFAACVAAFGESESDNAYVRAARHNQEEGELEVDEAAVVSRGDDRGAYVLAWMWVSDADAEINSAALESLAKAVSPTLSIDHVEDRPLLAAVDWLEETLSNFAEEIDDIDAEVIDSSAPTGVTWQTDFGRFTFLPSQAIEQMRARAEAHGLLDRADLHALRVWLDRRGEKLDRCIRAMTVGTDAASCPKWTADDDAKAAVEGWNVFDAEGRMEIQRIDELEMFESDAQAIDFIRERAVSGSELHQKALYIDRWSAAAQASTSRESQSDPPYRVTWSIDIDAESPQDAAEKALAIHRDASSIATVFEVNDRRNGSIRTIDLQEGQTPH
jgi:hypothetical protein